MTPSINPDSDDVGHPNLASTPLGQAISEESFASGRGLDSLLRVPVTLQVVLGSASLPVAQLMKLGRGAIVPLNHRVGEPVDVVVNGRIIARGEIVVVDEDNSRFGVSLTEIVGNNNGDLAR